MRPFASFGRFFVFMERYSKIIEKKKREIVLLRGSGCAYKKCTFCDYYTDMCKNEDENFALNCEVLENVTGEFGDLEVINSGSVFELDPKTLALIRDICRERNISTLHFESHYLYKNKIKALREYFFENDLKMKLGLETFDFDLRENVLNKGISEKDPKKISEFFDEANFLFGISGQNIESMRRDIELGLMYFERICINIMCENSTGIQPQGDVISDFIRNVYPDYRNNKRVDILMNNTDFGVGD